MGRKSKIARGLDINASAEKMAEKALARATFLTDEEYLNLEEITLNETQELEEAEVVRPIVLARWRTFLPEGTIRNLIEHRRLIREQREKVGWTRVTNFAYPMPRQPQIEQKPEVFAMGIDTDGWILPRHRWGEDKINKYARYYERPEIGFETDNLELTMKIANMMLTTIRPRPPRPPRSPSVSYLTVSGSSRATHAIIHAYPYLIKWKPEAEETLKLYRTHPITRLRT